MITEGIHRVKTVTALYELDFDHRTIRREPTGINTEDHDSEPLRKDGSAIPFRLVGNVELGKPMRLLLQIRDDGVSTLRTTTPVISIDK